MNKRTAVKLDGWSVSASLLSVELLSLMDLSYRIHGHRLTRPDTDLQRTAANKKRGILCPFFIRRCHERSAAGCLGKRRIGIQIFHLFLVLQLFIRHFQEHGFKFPFGVKIGKFRIKFVGL